MKIDFWHLFGLVSRARQLVTLEPGDLPKGDAFLYLIARSLCEQLERTNKGIATAAGFDEPLTADGWKFLAEVKQRFQ